MIIGEAHAWGLPVMGEMVPGGFDSPDHMRRPKVSPLPPVLVLRLGADWVKIPYAPGFEAVTSTCYVPAVILGGAKKGSERDMLEKIRLIWMWEQKGLPLEETSSRRIIPRQWWQPLQR